jgi:hypothetical protein
MRISSGPDPRLANPRFFPGDTLPILHGALAVLAIAALLAPNPLDADEEEDPLEKALRELDEESTARAPDTGGPMRTSDLYSTQVGGARLRLIDISLDALFAAGSSTERDDSLETLQGGGHDPRKRGFTVQNVELSLMGAVDPYFTGEAHIIYFLDPIEGETVVELEEAFLTTQQLPFGLQVKGGTYLTEFGRLNPTHPHAWHWLDQPIINTRLFGPDGMRGPGARVSWLTPLPWYSELYAGLQNANGETMASFFANDEFIEERPFDDRPFVEQDVRSLEDLVYSVRWENGFDATDEITSKLGVSGAFGPNSTGTSGYTQIYGADVVVKWRPLANDHGWPFVIFESEIMQRMFLADDAVDEDGNVFPEDTLRDWGTYAQILYGFIRNWAVGIRYEYANGRGDPTAVRQANPFRDTRHRVSPVLLYQPTEFSRLRLQYNHDIAEHLEDDDAHSVWFGFEFLFGSHPAHKY